MSLSHWTTRKVPSLHSFFSNVFIFNWRIIALQYCVSFCHTSTCISHWHTYVTLSLFTLECLFTFWDLSHLLAVSQLFLFSLVVWLRIYSVIQPRCVAFALYTPAMPGIGDKDDCDTRGKRCAPLTGTHRKEKQEIRWLIQDCDSPLLLSPSSIGRGICLLTDWSLQLSHAVDLGSASVSSWVGRLCPVCRITCVCLRLQWKLALPSSFHGIRTWPVEGIFRFWEQPAECWLCLPKACFSPCQVTGWLWLGRQIVGHFFTCAKKVCFWLPHRSRDLQFKSHFSWRLETRFTQNGAGLCQWTAQVLQRRVAACQQTVPDFSALFPFFSDNSTEFWDTDIKWFSLLESSSWLDIIRYFKALFCS